MKTYAQVWLGVLVADKEPAVCQAMQQEQLCCCGNGMQQQLIGVMRAAVQLKILPFRPYGKMPLRQGNGCLQHGIIGGCFIFYHGNDLVGVRFVVLILHSAGGV
jgi:hypothetical protein